MPWNDTDIHWMKPPIALAREGEAALGKNPIGYVIVCDEQAMGEACNEVDVRHDATAHAEFSRWAKIGHGADREDVREMYFEDRQWMNRLRPIGS
jgi:tRNA(adenine34) deaminase